MLEGLSKNLQGALSSFGRATRLNEANIREGMRQVRQALLEADVAYDVAQDFMRRVTEVWRKALSYAWDKCDMDFKSFLAVIDIMIFGKALFKVFFDPDGDSGTGIEVEPVNPFSFFIAPG